MNILRLSGARRLLLCVGAVTWLLPACSTVALNPGAVRSVLEAESDSLQVTQGERSIGNWRLSPGPDPDVLRIVTPRNQRDEVCFVSGPRSLCRAVGVGTQTDFIVRHSGADYPVRIIGVPPMTTFDPAYQTAHRGLVEIETPEVYELVAVAIAMTPIARAPRQVYVARNTDYYREVEAHFAPFADHPFVQAIDSALRQNRYYDIKTNAYAFEFRNGEIVHSEVFDRIEPSGNALAEYLDQMRDFASVSGFPEFYAQHATLYRDQARYYQEEIGLEAMLRWLEAEFPSAPRYDGHKIVFSPLYAGNQGMRSFESNGYRELQAHVDFPYPRNSDAQLPENARALRRGEIVFTELNHGFINPTTARYAGEVDRCIGDRAFWTVAGTQSDGYRSSEAVFNELMNWALVALYADTAVPESERPTVVQRLDRYMGAEGRGFLRFAAFREHLQALSRARSPGMTIEALYPEMLGWCQEWRNAQQAD